jgi:hypothetical protein
MYPNFYGNVQSKFTSLLKDLERKKFEDETWCLDAFVMDEHRKVALAWVLVNCILPSFAVNNGKLKCLDFLGARTVQNIWRGALLMLWRTPSSFVLFPVKFWLKCTLSEPVLLDFLKRPTTCI